MEVMMQAARETFTWFNLNLDITRALADVSAGKVRPKQIDLGPEFIKGYAEKILALKKDEGVNQSSVGLMVGVDAQRAMELPPAILDEPLFLMYVGKGRGLLKMETGAGAEPGHVLADGNHRLSRAFLDGRELPLKALVFSPAQSKKYYR